MKNFEDRLERLEKLNEILREENVPLDQALKHFEEGIKLAKSLENDLTKVERKIEILINQPEDENDEANLELFPGPSEEE